MNLGENIYRFRSQMGMSQGDLSSKLEVSRQSVSKWENNSAVPELDKLLKLSDLFGVTLDELVKGEKEHVKENQPPMVVQQLMFVPNSRILIGMGILIIGVVFFLLAIFWGSHLAMGEELGEFIGVIMVLMGLAMAALHHCHVLYTCMMIYFIYSVVSFGFVRVNDLHHYLFIGLTGLILFVWFILWGMSANREEEARENP